MEGESNKDSAKLIKRKSEEDETERLSKDSDSISKARQTGMLISILVLQMCAFMPETAIYPFYPKVARAKGLTSTEIGAVLAAFDSSRFLASLIAGSMVSCYYFCETTCYVTKVFLTLENT